jgi:hypothetical protein
MMTESEFKNILKDELEYRRDETIEDNMICAYFYGQKISDGFLYENRDVFTSKYSEIISNNLYTYYSKKYYSKKFENVGNIRYAKMLHVILNIIRDRKINNLID